MRVGIAVQPKEIEGLVRSDAVWKRWAVSVLIGIEKDICSIIFIITE